MKKEGMNRESGHMMVVTGKEREHRAELVINNGRSRVSSPGRCLPDSSGKVKALTAFQVLLSLFLLALCVWVPTVGWALSGLEAVPQSPVSLVGSVPDVSLISPEHQEEMYGQLRERHFSPWHQAAPRQAAETLDWVFNHYGTWELYGENLQPRSAAWVEARQWESRIEAVGELNQRAVSVRPTSLRLMPTETPAFLSPDLPGEGYPFDYLQNSLVHPGEPLFASHFSLDGLWVWCDASYASGWVPAHHLAFVEEAKARRWMEMPLAVVIRENVLFRHEGTSLFRAKVGTILPLLERDITAHTLVVPVRGMDGIMQERAVQVAAEEAAPMPLALTPWTSATVAVEFMDETYGWGGYLGNRDCSATTRDFLLPFGIWLPRNSRAQAQTGQVVSLEDLSREEKYELIVNQGVPFLSLVGMPGHIMLYVGTYQGEPLIMHNLWGIRTESEAGEGRYIVGRCVITTLDVGADLPDHVPGRLLIDRIQQLTLPTGERT